MRPGRAGPTRPCGRWRGSPPPSRSGEARAGQADMAEAVARADRRAAATSWSRPGPAPASRWPTWSRPSSPAAPRSSPPPPRPCRTSWPPRTCRSWPSTSAWSSSWAVLKGRSNYLCLQRVREARDPGAGQLELEDLAPVLPQGGRAAGDVGGHHGHRRPRRAGLEPERPGVGVGQRHQRGVPRGHALPARRAVLRGERPPAGRGGRRRRRQHPPVRPRRRVRRRRSCPSTTWS